MTHSRGVVASPFSVAGTYTLSSDCHLTVEGNFRCNGTFTFGDAATDNLSVGGNMTFTGTSVANTIKFSNTVNSATDGTLISTGSTWISHSTAGQCAVKFLCANAATTGDYATLRVRARADAAGATVCGNFSASGGANNHGDLYAVQGYAQPNAYTNSGTPYTVGLYSCIDRTSGGSSAGYDWSTWIDTHMQVKASGSSYLCRMSHNGTVANDGCFTIYNGGRMPVLFNFEDVAGFLSTASGTITTSHKLACTIAGVGTVYIPLASGIA
jgi:hypothetical protein